MVLIGAFTKWYFQMIRLFGLNLYVLLGMTIESSVFPLPSEVVMPPAGFLASSIPHLIFLIFLGTLGSLIGALCNYAVGAYLGRPFLEKYGRYFLINKKKLAHIDNFWGRYGEGSTFIGRLFPGVRHLISIPAGLSRMNLWKFAFFTATGAGLWVTVLTVAGWWLGHYWHWTVEELAEKLQKQMLPYLMGSIILLIACYIAKVIWWNKRKAA